jgi:hypothetical protein
MGELIFFGVIILFSILESVVRARKQRDEEAQEGEGTGIAVERRTGWPDEDDEERDAPRTAEGMLPRDLWEELAGLAAGRTQGAEVPDGPAHRPRGPAPRPRAPAPSRRSAPTRTPTPTRSAPPAHTAPTTRVSLPDEAPTVYDSDPSYDDLVAASSRIEHAVHRSHAGYGTDPSERQAAVAERATADPRNRNAERVRAMLRGTGGTDGLQQAFILREVLGPPVAMKDD